MCLFSHASIVVQKPGLLGDKVGVHESSQITAPLRKPQSPEHIPEVSSAACNSFLESSFDRLANKPRKKLQ